MQMGLKNTSKTAILIDDFFTLEECEACIDLFTEFPHKCAPTTGNAHNLSENIMLGDLKNAVYPNPWLTDEARQAWFKIRDFGRTLGKELQWAQVYKWPENSYMSLHHDVASRATTLTSIIWLNDEFDYGQLAFKDGTMFTPKTGRAIWYDGIHYWHRVRQVKNGTRWALGAWYKDIECNTNSMKKT